MENVEFTKSDRILELFQIPKSTCRQNEGNEGLVSGEYGCFPWRQFAKPFIKNLNS